MPDIHFFNIEVWIRGKTIVQCGFDGFDRFINIEHLPVLDTVGVGISKAQVISSLPNSFLRPAMTAILVVPMSRPTIMGCSVVHKFVF